MSSPRTNGWMDAASSQVIEFFRPKMDVSPLAPVILPLGILAYLLPDAVATALWPLEKGQTEVLMLRRLITQPVAIALLLLLFRQAKVFPDQSFGRSRTTWAMSLRNGIILALMWGPIVVGMNLAMSLILNQWDEHPALALFTNGPWWLVGTVVINAVVLAPIGEELFFRGLLQRWAIGAVGIWPGILVASAIFGIAHAAVRPTPIPLTILGVALGLSLCRDRSLGTPIFFHAAFNGLNLLLAAALLFREAG